MNKNFRTVIIYLVLLGVLVAFVMNSFGNSPEAPKELTTSQFSTAAEAGLVSEVKFVLRDNNLSGTYWADEDAKTAKAKPVDFRSTWAGSDSFTVFAQKNNLSYEVDTSGPSPWFTIISSLLPILLLVFVMFFFLNQMQGGNSRS